MNNKSTKGTIFSSLPGYSGLRRRAVRLLSKSSRIHRMAVRIARYDTSAFAKEADVRNSIYGQLKLRMQASIRGSVHIRNLATNVANERSPTVDRRRYNSVDITMGATFPETIRHEGVPVVVIDAIGTSNEYIDKALDQVYRLQLKSAAFRPLILTDTLDFSKLDLYGWGVESIINKRKWRTLGVDKEWDDYVRERLGLVARSYGATCVISVGKNGLNHAGLELACALLGISAATSDGTLLPES